MGRPYSQDLRERVVNGSKKPAADSAEQPMGSQHHGRAHNGQLDQGHAAELINLVDGVADAVLPLHRGALRPSTIIVRIDHIVRCRERLAPDKRAQS